MTENYLESLPEWNQLAAHADRIELPENHLRNLIAQQRSTCSDVNFSLQKALLQLFI